MKKTIVALTLITANWAQAANSALDFCTNPHNKLLSFGRLFTKQCSVDAFNHITAVKELADEDAVDLELLHGETVDFVAFDTHEGKSNYYKLSMNKEKKTAANITRVCLPNRHVRNLYAQAKVHLEHKQTYLSKIPAHRFFYIESPENVTASRFCFVDYDPATEAGKVLDRFAVEDVGDWLIPAVQLKMRVRELESAQ